MKTCYNRDTMNQASVIDDFWTHDIKLFNGRFAFYHDELRPVRGKIHTSEEPYDLMGKSEQDIRPIPTRRGTRTYIMLHPYVFEPILTFTVGLYQKPKSYADLGEAIGETVGKPKQEGVRDVQIGSVQAWYYHEARTLEIWECFLDSRFRKHPLVDDPQMRKLWQGVEQWLGEHFPEATRIVTPFNDPIAHSIEEYQTFLNSLGYEPVAKAAFGKPLKGR
jgi:hypothetical protein